MTKVIIFKDYILHDDGKIYSMKSNKFMKARICRGGYYRIALCIDKVVKKFYVHRLVAMFFIENKNCKPQVNHIDGNKLNNNVSNLEWVTCSENILHAHSIGLAKTSEKCKNINRDRCSKIRGDKHPSSKKVLQINTGKIFNSLTEASMFFNCNVGNLQKQIINKRKNKHNLKYI